jgi:hypothetical protein
VVARRARLAVLLLYGCLAVFALAQCRPAQTQPSEAPWRQYVIDGTIPQWAEAITECRAGKPVVLIPRFDTLSTVAMEELWAHEQVHVRQFSRNPLLTCEQNQARVMSSARTLLAAEAEAYCAGAMWSARKHGHDPLAVVLHSAGGIVVLWKQLDGAALEVTPAEILTTFIRVCPQAIHYRS